MTTINFTVNGQPQSLDIDPTTPLLWTLRDHLQMTGTKFGCGIGMCGERPGLSLSSCKDEVSHSPGWRGLFRVEGSEMALVPSNLVLS